MSNQNKRYQGAIHALLCNSEFALIKVAEVMQEDGSAADFAVHKDILLHRDDCKGKLDIGEIVSFSVCPDPGRGHNALRAVDAVRKSPLPSIVHIISKTAAP